MIAIYVRVSTEEQAKKGFSIEEQIQTCLKKAGTMNVSKYIDDGYSGELLERPQLKKLRRDIETGKITKLICYDPDRLSRKLLHQLLLDDEFRSYQVDIQFVNGEYANNPEGQLFYSLRGAISEFEKAKIKERTSSGRKRKALKGYIVKDSGLYGYDYDKKKQTYIINEHEAKIVQMIFKYFTDPSSPFNGINSIARHLTKMGIPTKRGGKVWHRQVVRQILTNESYTGTHYQNKYDTEGDYVNKQAGLAIKSGRLKPEADWIKVEIPIIIEKMQFEYAQQLIDKARRLYAGYSRYPYLLSGLVRCGRCGATMNGKKRKSHGKDFYVYECRKSYSGSKQTGCGRMMSENKLNKNVWKAIYSLLQENVIEASFECLDQNETIELVEEDNIEEELAKTKKGKKRLWNLFSILEEEELDIEELTKNIAELTKKEKYLNEQLIKIREKKHIKKSPLNVQLKEIIEYFSGEEKLTKDDKQIILRMLIKEVHVIDATQVNIYTL